MGLHAPSVFWHQGAELHSFHMDLLLVMVLAELLVVAG